MKIAIQNFQGEAPILAGRLLPEGYGSKVINANLISGDLDSFADIGNPFQLSKDPIINAIWLMKGPPPTFWLQFTDAEVAYGVNIDVSLGTIPGDTAYRTFITGLAGGPKQTNLYYATDPSQQGTNPAGAYPYQLFPLGIASPTAAPTAVGPVAPSGPVTTYEYAQPTTINNVTVDNPGSGLSIGSTLPVEGGTLSLPSFPAVITVNNVTTSGAIDTTVTGNISLTQTGFYALDEAPSSPASVSGSSGVTLSLTTQDIADSNFAGWTQISTGGATNNHWTLSNNTWRSIWADTQLQVCYSNDSFGLKTSSSFVYQADTRAVNNGGGEYPDMILYFLGIYSGGVNNVGPALCASVSDGTFTLFSSIKNSGSQPTTGALEGTQVSTTSASISGDTWYRIRITGAAQTNSTTPGFSVTATIAAAATPGTIIATVTGFVPYGGETLGVGGKHRGNYDHGNDLDFLNILVQTTQPANTYTSEATSYVYTYVTTKGTGDNAITEESGPSDPSATITFYLDTTTGVAVMSPVQVSIPPAPSGQNITNYNLYRLVQLSDGSEIFEFVTELAASTTDTVTYTDTTLDAALGDPLLSTDWVPPPDNLQGILALPDGEMSGFFGNTLCFCAQNYPFAWPVDSQYPTDAPIVGTAAIDSTVLALTTGHPYTCFGSPGNKSMSKETSNQGCTSKLSIATHKRLGVIYSSGNGLCYYRGQGDLDLIRMPNGKPYFSVEQWQALDPASIYGVVHDDRYWFWWDNGTDKGGYCLDLSPAGLGLIELDFHVTCAYVDPSTDILYFVPDSSTYPINGNVVTAALNVLSEWEAGSGLRERSWERDEILLPRPTAFFIARVRAEDYSDLQLTIACRDESTGDVVTSFSGAVTSAKPFVIAPKVGIRWSVTAAGTSRWNSLEIVSRPEEFSP